MSAKVVPAIAAAILFAGTAGASAVAPTKNSGDVHNFYAGHNNDASAMHNVYAGHNNQGQAAATPNHSLQKQRPVFGGE